MIRQPNAEQRACRLLRKIRVREIIRAMNRPEDAHPDIVKALEYYAQAGREWERLPGKQHFDPMAIPEIVPRTVLMELKFEPDLRVLMRYAGSKIEESAKCRLKNRLLKDRLPPHLVAAAERNLMQVVDSRKPTWRRGLPAVQLPNQNIQLERAYIPLATNGVDVDAVLSIAVHTELNNASQSKIVSLNASSIS